MTDVPPRSATPEPRYPDGCETDAEHYQHKQRGLPRPNDPRMCSCGDRVDHPPKESTRRSSPHAGPEFRPIEARSATPEPPDPLLDAVRAALTDEDEIAHGESVSGTAGLPIGLCAYCGDDWPCRTQRGIGRLLDALESARSVPQSEPPSEQVLRQTGGARWANEGDDQAVSPHSCKQGIEPCAACDEADRIGSGAVPLSEREGLAAATIEALARVLVRLERMYEDWPTLDKEIEKDIAVGRDAMQAVNRLASQPTEDR